MLVIKLCGERKKAAMYIQAALYSIVFARF